MVLSSSRVVILGAGYGGLRVALDLARARFPTGKRPELLLVDLYPFHQSIVQLHEVAAGSLDPELAAVPLSWLLRGLPVRFVQAEAKALDLGARKVRLDGGALEYDYLVVAVGSESDYFGIPGLSENSMGLKSLEEAQRIRSHIRRMFLLASQARDPQVRRQYLTFIVGGGGFTGTELTGELADSLPELAKRYGLAPAEPKVLVLEGKPTLLPGAATRIGEYAAWSLTRRGVELSLGDPVSRVDDGQVTLASGRVFRSRTIIWTGGVRASRLVEASGLPVGAKGRALVNPYLESVDFPNVYVIGDAALSVDPRSGRPMPPSAQLAIMHGRVAARNIRSTILGQRRVAFTGRPVADVITLGRHDAIAEPGPVLLFGRVAHLLKSAAIARYYYEIGGLRLMARMAPLPGRARLWPEAVPGRSEEVRRVS